jgi:uncharacterized protein (TIGR03435 family)
MKSILLLAALASAHAQSPVFEVVSIKRSPPDAGSTVGSRGGPGTRTPGTWTCSNMSLSNIVWIGFNLRSQQLVAPDWMSEPRFDITAKIPEGATREEFYQMFQNMLVERFGLKFHREQKEVQGYELTVGKSGPKFKESGPEAPKDSAGTPPSPGTRPSLGADGFPVLVPGISGVAVTGNRARGQWMRAPLDRLVRELDNSLGKPVVDATGLTAKYDLSLYWVPDQMRPDAGGPTLSGALQDQLGLRLEGKKVTIPIVVIDHAERVPTEN